MQITRNFAQKWKPKKKVKKYFSMKNAQKISLFSLNIISFTPTTYTTQKKIIIPQIFLFLLFWKELYSSHFTTLHNEWRILPYPTTQIQMHLNVAHSGWWKEKIEMKIDKKKRHPQECLQKSDEYLLFIEFYWGTEITKKKTRFFAAGAIKWHS